MYRFGENQGNFCSTLGKWATFWCKTCRRDFVWPLFSSAGLHTVRGEWAKWWTALREKKNRVSTLKMTQKQKNTINVNAFSVTSTSFLRPHLLLPTESVNRFPWSLVPGTYLMPIITLKGFFCPWDVSLSVVHPDPSLPMFDFALPFILQTLCGSAEE